MNITQITTAAGAHKRRKRVGRGEASGHGKTSGRGTKGCGARAGWRQRVLFEGGQLPIFRRLPKRGFSNFQYRTTYQIVNAGSLQDRFDEGAHVTAASLHAAGLIRDPKEPVKILGEGDLKKRLTVEAQRFSGSALRKIEAAGGIVKKLGPQPAKKFVKRPPPPPQAKTAPKEGEKPRKTKGAPEAKPTDEAAPGATPKSETPGAPAKGAAAKPKKPAKGPAEDSGPPVKPDEGS